MGGRGDRVGSARGVGGRRALLGLRRPAAAADSLTGGSGPPDPSARRCRPPLGRHRGVGPRGRRVAGRRSRARGMVGRSPRPRIGAPVGRGGGRMGRGRRRAPRAPLPRRCVGVGRALGGGGPRLGRARRVSIGHPRVAARRASGREPALRDAPRPGRGPLQPRRRGARGDGRPARRRGRLGEGRGRRPAAADTAAAAVAGSDASPRTSGPRRETPTTAIVSRRSVAISSPRPLDAPATTATSITR